MNINILLTRVPIGIHAMTRLNEDDSYTILLDKNLSREQAIRELLHELSHIKRNDFDSALQASLLETMVRESNFIPQLEDINFYYHVV